MTGDGPATIRGIATYYGTGGPGSYAAMGGYRDGSRVIVLVESFHDHKSFSVTLNVTTQCGACRWVRGGTVIDLSIPVWRALAGDLPLSRGVLPVTVTVLEGSVGQ